MSLCVFLQATFLFHIGASRGEINPQFYKML